MDELQISGKRFISSRRIARDNGYTSDYIGQLIRGGKVIGQKVGRAWYVDAVSFDTFLGSESIPAKLPEEKIPVEIAPAQLPEEKVLGSASPQPDHFLQEVSPPPRVPASVVLVEEKKEETHYVPLHIIKKEEAPMGLRYYHDTEPSLPEMRSSVKISPRTKTFEAPTRVRYASKLPVVALAGAGVAVFIFCAVVSSVVSLNLSITEGNAASASYSLSW